MKKHFSKYSRKGLPGGANEQQSFTEGFIVSKRGQWDFPGMPTMIPNANGKITTQGVEDILFGFDDQGNSQIMYPDGEYQFSGNDVYEIPLRKAQYEVDLGQAYAAKEKGQWDMMDTPRVIDKRKVQETRYRFRGGGYYDNTPPYGTPTVSDSLALYKNALAKDAFYANNPNYIEEFFEPSDTQFSNQGVRDWIFNNFNSGKKVYEEGVSKNLEHINSIFGTNITKEDANSRLKLINSNLLQTPDFIGEQFDDYFNPSTPPILLSRNIAPQGTKIYRTADIDLGDRSYVPYYDPLMVKPWEMLTDEEKAWRRDPSLPRPPQKPKGTTDPKKSVVVNLIKSGLAKDTASAKKVRAELIEQVFGEKATGSAAQNTKLNKWLFDNPDAMTAYKKTGNVSIAKSEPIADTFPGVAPPRLPIKPAKSVTSELTAIPETMSVPVKKPVTDRKHHWNPVWEVDPNTGKFRGSQLQTEPSVRYRFQDGGEAFESELTDEEIEQYKKGGYIVEELPKAQVGESILNVQEQEPQFKVSPQQIEERRLNPYMYPIYKGWSNQGVKGGDYGLGLGADFKLNDKLSGNVNLNLINTRVAGPGFKESNFSIQTPMVTLKRSFKQGGHIENLPKAQEGLFKYSGRPEATYKKDANGNWLISLPSTKGEYIPIKDPTGKRTAELNKNAYSYDPDFTQNASKALRQSYIETYLQEKDRRYDQMLDPQNYGIAVTDNPILTQSYDQQGNPIGYRDNTAYTKDQEAKTSYHKLDKDFESARQAEQALQKVVSSTDLNQDQKKQILSDPEKATEVIQAYDKYLDLPWVAPTTAYPGDMPAIAPYFGFDSQTGKPVYSKGVEGRSGQGGVNMLDKEWIKGTLGVMAAPAAFETLGTAMNYNLGNLVGLNTPNWLTAGNAFTALGTKNAVTKNIPNAIGDIQNMYTDGVNRENVLDLAKNVFEGGSKFLSLGNLAEEMKILRNAPALASYKPYKTVKDIYGQVKYGNKLLNEQLDENSEIDPVAHMKFIKSLKPFMKKEEGGQVLELTPEEIQWYLDNGYNVDYM